MAACMLSATSTVCAAVLITMKLCKKWYSQVFAALLYQLLSKSSVELAEHIKLCAFTRCSACLVLASLSSR